MKPKQQLERWLDLPEGSLSGELRLEIYAGRRAVLDGACTIRVCREDEIRLHTVGGDLCFRGQELILTAFGKAGTVIEGRLCAVEFG